MNRFRTAKNSGALYRNDRKTKETDPDIKGQITINGEEFWVSGWSAVSKRGMPYLSLSIIEKDIVHEQGMKQAREAAA